MHEEGTDDAMPSKEVVWVVHGDSGNASQGRSAGHAEDQLVVKGGPDAGGSGAVERSGVGVNVIHSLPRTRYFGLKSEDRRLLPRRLHQLPACANLNSKVKNTRYHLFRTPSPVVVFVFVAKVRQAEVGGDGGRSTGFDGLITPFHPVREWQKIDDGDQFDDHAAAVPN